MNKFMRAMTGTCIATVLTVVVCDAQAANMYTKTYPNGGQFEVPLHNGKWEGVGKFSLNDSHIEIPFKDGKPNGEVVLNDEKTGLSLYGDDFKMEMPYGSAEGKLLCQFEDVYEKLYSTPVELQRNAVMDTLLQCVLLKKVASSNEVPVKITFDGNFTFPKFNETSKIEITDVNNMLDSVLANIDDVPPELRKILTAFRQLQIKRIVWTIDKNNKDVTGEVYDSSGKQIAQLKEDLYNIPALLTGLKMMLMTGDDKISFNTAKKINLTKWEVNSTGKDPEFIFEGKYTPFFFDVETGSTMKMFNARGQNIMDLVTLDDGFKLDVKYPMTAKKLLTADISFRFQAYENIKDATKKAQSALEWRLMVQRASDDADQFRMDVKNLDIYDIQGNALFSMKDFAIDTNTDVLHGEVTLFKGQPNEQVLTAFKTDAPVLVKMKNGKIKTLSFKQSLDYITNAVGQQVMGQVATPFLNEGMQYLQESPAVLLAPVSVLGVGGLAGYTMAMNRHRANTILDDALKCAVLVATRGYGESAVARESCYQAQYLGQAKPDYIVDIVAEREDHGDTFSCITFTGDARNGVRAALASRTDALGGENVVYCYGVNQNVWTSGNNIEEALHKIKAR